MEEDYQASSGIINTVLKTFDFRSCYWKFFIDQLEFQKMNTLMKRCFKMSKKKDLFGDSKLFKLPTEAKCLLMVFNDDYFWTK